MRTIDRRLAAIETAHRPGEKWFIHFHDNGVHGDYYVALGNDSPVQPDAIEAARAAGYDVRVIEIEYVEFWP